uniref:8-oxoguanine DNA glycosylase n=1 Tax=Naja naja TaxID=35670 RepID=A0A8C6V9C3_NAJNA
MPDKGKKDNCKDACIIALLFSLPRATPWRSLPCPRTELRLDLVLCGGQTFRLVWSETSPGYWTGVLAGRVWTLTQSEEHLWYTFERSGSHLSGELARAIDGLTPSQILQDYFQLHVNVSALYQGWSYVDSHFREIGVKFPGRQTYEVALETDVLLQ